MRWLTPGLGVKRWLILVLFGVVALASGFAGVILAAGLTLAVSWTWVAVICGLGVLCVGLGLLALTRILIAPYRALAHSANGDIVQAVYLQARRRRGIRVVAIGGGTGLPSVLRAMKPSTGDITAIVTVADDGGSSGRLRRDMGVLPPGDLRNNIVALADDESLMTRLFQYRFESGDLQGHAFGNLFIAALAGVAGGLENALIETQRVLNIQGRVLPSTLADVELSALVRLPTSPEPVTVRGESAIPASGGSIERVSLVPPDAPAYPGSAEAILEADLVVIGPGSLYTSILPNLVVQGIAEALRATRAYKVYVCNVAMQPGETDGYSVAEHVMALERHIGRGVFQAVLANNAYPTENAGLNTRYVQTVSEHHEVAQRYEMIYCDLTDAQHPWRHDPHKLAAVLLKLRTVRRASAAAAL